MNLLPYNPFNKTYKYTCFLNQAYHIKNKTEAAPCIDSNITYTKSYSKRRYSKKNNRSSMKKHSVLSIDNVQLQNQISNQLQTILMNHLNEQQKLSSNKNQQKQQEFNLQTSQQKNTTKSQQNDGDTSKKKIFSTLDEFKSVEQSYPRGKNKKSKKRKRKLKEPITIVQYAKPHRTIHKNQIFDKTQSAKIYKDNERLIYRIANASCQIFPRKASDGLPNGTEKNLLEKFETNCRKYSKIRRVYNNKNTRVDRLILNNKSQRPKTLTQISEQIDKIYLNPQVKHSSIKINRSFKNKDWNKYFNESTRFIPNSQNQRRYSMGKCQNLYQKCKQSQEIKICQQV